MGTRSPGWMRIDASEPLALCCLKGVLSGMSYQEFLTYTGAPDSAHLRGFWADAEKEVEETRSVGAIVDIPFEHPDLDVAGTDGRYSSGFGKGVLDEFLVHMGEKSAPEQVKHLTEKARRVRQRRRT